jgi:hypothetical protein
VAQKAYHAEYSMPSGCDSASAQENQHFAFGNKHKSEVTPPSWSNVARKRRIALPLVL